ncbi:MAG: hypothetical protein ACOYNZ_15785 [Rhodoferax sp.]
MKQQFARACSHYFCEMRCESKKPWAKRKTPPGLAPGKALQCGPWLFWPQPEGNGMKKVPLGVALLGKAPALPLSRALIGAFFIAFALVEIV